MNGTNWYLVGTLAALAFCGLIAEHCNRCDSAGAETSKRRRRHAGAADAAATFSKDAFADSV